MGILQKIYGYMNKKESLDVSPRLELFTKYGPAMAQMYKYKGVEYLLFESPKIESIEINTGYIYTNRHAQHEMRGLECSCNNQIDVALKLILQEGGFAIYISQNPLDIDECLYKLGVKVPEAKSRENSAVEILKASELSSKEYALLLHIIGNIGLQKLRLICSDPGIALHIQRLGIELVEWAGAIEFEYGQSSL